MQTLEDKQIDNFDNKKKFDRLGSRRTKVIKKRRDIRAKKDSSSVMQKGGDRRTAAERAEDDKLYGKGSSNESADLGYESVEQMNKYAKLYGNPSKSKAWHDKNNAAKKKLAKIKVNERYNKGAMQKGGARNKKFLGGLAGTMGAMQGFKGGAFGNSNPMDPNAAQDPNAAVAQKGGLRDRRKAAKKRMKKI